MKRLLVLAVLALSACKSSAPAPLRVAAASDLTDVFAELGQRFEATHPGAKVEFTFGSSGLLAKQLHNGAPFDVFASASEGYAREADCDAESLRPLSRGRLALWPGTFTLESLVASKGRIALANPEHAPYGRAAKEALEKAGLWAQLEPRIVFSENVRQALQFVDSGNAEVGFVAWSNVVKRGVPPSALVEASLHAPIEQVVVRCPRGKQPELAREFTDFLGTTEARAELQRSGFAAPNEPGEGDRRSP